MIPVFALPLPDGRFRLIYEHAVDLPKPGHPDPVRELTQRCTDVLEMYVRRHPELWMWMHRRWRDEPGSGIGDRGSGGNRAADEARMPDPRSRIPDPETRDA